MHAGSASLDIAAGQFKRIQCAAKTSLGVCHNRRKPIDVACSLKRLDLIGALQGAIDLTCQFRPGIGWIE